MKRRRDEPTQLGEALNVLAGRLRKVDLRTIDQLRALWPEVVDPVVAAHCRPEFIKDGVLVISVPSGAFAERILMDRDSILLGCQALGDAAPTSLRTTRSDAPKSL